MINATLSIWILIATDKRLGKIAILNDLFTITCFEVLDYPLVERLQLRRVWGKNLTVTDFICGITLCAVQLSINDSILRFCFTICFLRFRSPSEKRSAIIRAFLLEVYSRGNDFMPAKHRGFLDFSIIKGLHFSVPDMFAAKSKVTRSLLSFPPWHFSHLNFFGQPLLTQKSL